MEFIFIATVFVLFATLIHVGYTFDVTLEELSTLYLPYEYTPSPNFGLGEDASEQLTYDNDRKMLYSVGKKLNGKKKWFILFSFYFSFLFPFLFNYKCMFAQKKPGPET